MKNKKFVIIVLFIICPVIFSSLVLANPVLNWVAGMNYQIGDNVLFNDNQYKCIQNHTSQMDWTPNITPALWNLVPTAKDSYGFYYWASQVSYKAGDQVDYNGAIYQCSIAHTSQTGWEPVYTPTLWQYLYNVNNNVNLSILSPLAGERFITGESLQFKASVTGDGLQTGAQLQWSSNIDGYLGVGLEIPVKKLSPGNHQITVSGYGTQSILNVRIFADLWEFYQASPSPAEVGRTVSQFNFTWIDYLAPNPVNDQPWSMYDSEGFNQLSSAPSKMVAYAKLDVLRHQQFSEPLPISNGKTVIEHFHTYVNSFYLYLYNCYNYGGGGNITLNRTFSLWDVRQNSDPNIPLPDHELSLYIHPLYLLIHEERHSEPGDPGHIDTATGQMDPTFENGSGHAWATIYLMWVYKYGLYDPPAIKEEAKNIAKFLLESRFYKPIRHSNQKVQAIIDELLSSN